ncbi:hypothetical protein TL16_g05555 [Triparma laevis f. inornata]|uniref:ethanolamine kinase n=1 Tax=Triparma laevis f. inornata TaxID=1714386 RepID=A0A9W7AFP3_9STRA|nr:hypothetical protein TL16_g05555 [Triparma laevis f. inornata]
MVCGHPYILDEIDKNLKGEELKTRILEIFTLMSPLSPSLTPTTPSTLTPISGGITNALYLLTLPTSKYLLRIFGGEGMINRDSETLTYSNLSTYLGGVSYHGRFGNGRIEGFLEDFKACDLESMRGKDVIESVVKLHGYVPEGGVGECELWEQLETWFGEAKDSKTKVNLKLINEIDLNKLQTRVQKLKRQIQSSSSAKIVFSHNDLLSANIMRSGSKIQLIDFEYGGANYAAFDLANHFNEYAGGTVDGVPDYGLLPGEGEKREWVDEYCRLTGGGRGCLI